MPVEPAQPANPFQEGLAVRRPVVECLDDEAGCLARLLEAGEDVAVGDAVGGRVGHGDADFTVCERGALRAVEGDQGQGRRLGRTLDLGLAGEAGEDDEVCIADALGARQTSQAQLSVELAAVLVCSRHHQCARPVAATRSAILRATSVSRARSRRTVPR